MRTVSRRIDLRLLLLGLALFAVFLAAGVWQIERARYKESLQIQVTNAEREPPIRLSGRVTDAQTLNFHSLTARGRWIVDKSIFIDNKVREGVVGYHLLTPLRIEGSQACVLVNRGWVAAPALRSELPRVTTSAAVVEVSGIARVPTTRFLELSKETVEGRVWQNLTIERFRAWSGLMLLPVVIHQGEPPEPGLTRVAPAPEAMGIGPSRHRGYATMWFSLAALTLILIVVTSFNAWKRNE